MSPRLRSFAAAHKAEMGRLIREWLHRLPRRLDL